MIIIDNIEFNSFKEATRYLQLQATLEGNELSEEEAHQLINDEYLDVQYSDSIEADESIDELISSEYSDIQDVLLNYHKSIYEQSELNQMHCL